MVVVVHGHDGRGWPRRRGATAPSWTRSRCRGARLPIPTRCGEPGPCSDELVAAVHVEPSNGIVQPLAPLGVACREHEALFLVDATVSLGGCALDVDAWDMDACVAGLGGCLAGPSASRRSPTATPSRRRSGGAPARPGADYLDLAALQDYWSPDRRQHHAPPSGLLYALREALRLLHAEGLERRWMRHRRVNEALAAGLAAMGLHRFGDERHRAPLLAVVQVPAGVTEAVVRQQLLADYGIEIAAGAGRSLRPRLAHGRSRLQRPPGERTDAPRRARAGARRPRLPRGSPRGSTPRRPDTGAGLKTSSLARSSSLLASCASARAAPRVWLLALP